MNSIGAFSEISDKKSAQLHLINPSSMAAAHTRELQYDHCATVVQNLHRQLITLFTELIGAFSGISDKTAMDQTQEHGGSGGNSGSTHSRVAISPLSYLNTAIYPIFLYVFQNGKLVRIDYNPPSHGDPPQIPLILQSTVSQTDSEGNGMRII